MPPSSAEIPPPPGTEPAPLDAAAALDEIQRVTRRVRVGFRWEALQYAVAAVLFPAFVLLQHLHPRQANWIFAVAVALLLVGAVLHSRAGVVSWGSTRRSKLVGWCYLPLFVGANASLGWAPPGLSPWLVIAAIAPGLSPLVAAVWVLRR